MSRVAGADAASVESALRAIGGVEGWLTEGQAKRLWAAADRVPEGGRILEIGSYRGRSTIVLARGARPGVEVVAVDPHAGNDRGPREIAGFVEEGRADREAFAANLDAADVAGAVRHVPLPSAAALSVVEGPLDVLYVDGAHRYRLASADVSLWGARLRPGGTLLVHDAFSAIGVTLAQLRHLAISDRFRYIGRTRSLAEYRREDVSGRRRTRSTARQVAQLPWFVRNVAIKVALVVRWHGLARALGHRGRDWPY